MAYAVRRCTCIAQVAEGHVSCSCPALLQPAETATASPSPHICAVAGYMPPFAYQQHSAEQLPDIQPR